MKLSHDVRCISRPYTVARHPCLAVPLEIALNLVEPKAMQNESSRFGVGEGSGVQPLRVQG